MPSSGLDLTGIQVLVVEDDGDSADMLRQIVESFGASVRLAANGEDALAAIEHARPDLILSDIRMPALDGYQLMNALRDQPDLSRIPVIALTALDTGEDVMRTWSAGFSGHLVKPVDYETIAAQLERFFRTSPPQGAAPV